MSEKFNPVEVVGFTFVPVCCSPEIGDAGNPFAVFAADFHGQEVVRSDGIEMVNHVEPRRALGPINDR